MTVTKQDITEHLYDVLGFTKGECKGLVEAFFDTIRETLAQGEDVKLSGFGNFTLREKRARPGLNPKTKERTVVSARRVVVFRAGSLLRNHCNPRDEDGSAPRA
ncbi:integration host factor subunit alpha (plasmid) [Acidithiobacillus caldus]|jgi:integration host factor subunit alpha|uniref:Integration host factor subunit alpha n=1 Tax=Acidithiobacillus caldus (strain SM-1) TaxID=990288 RepID=F9ZUM1_ACICS|nr:integration host factor subunit alpha [Acidithiobacillus caldus]AEK59568.1 integration host factor, alpha subunit [Acidithiobacillus caldus SM-1]AUW34139.1 integration host factor subunit alpha [Acidithiobacillus caldus]QER44738.1 putative integrase [Acidithiobacillus caldus]